MFFIIAEGNGLPSASEFTSYLTARWPGATVKPISNPERKYVLEFHVPMAGSRPHLPLLFCDESMNGEVKVTPTMTAAQILEAFHESGG